MEFGIAVAWMRMAGKEAPNGADEPSAASAVQNEDPKNPVVLPEPRSPLEVSNWHELWCFGQKHTKL